MQSVTVPLRSPTSSTATSAGSPAFTSSHRARVLLVARTEAWRARILRTGGGPSHRISRPASSAMAMRKAVSSSVPWIWAWTWKFRRDPVASTNGRPRKAQPARLAASTTSRATSLVYISPRAVTTRAAVQPARSP